MKKLTPLFAGLVLIAGFVCPPVQAAFVHLGFYVEEGGRLGLRGSKPDEPWDTYGYGAPTGPIHLDIFYDPSAALADIGDDASSFTFTDPAKAFWRLSTTSDYLPFELQHPIDVIQVFPSAVRVSLSAIYGSFDMDLDFASPLATALSLPSPPLPALAQSGREYWIPSQFLIQGGQELFNLPAPGSGMLGADLFMIEAEVIDTIPPLVPVPEPSTYGLMGALALGALATLRRRAGSHARC